MGYKLLGFVAWRGARWYLRRRMPDGKRKAAITALAGLVVGGLVVAQRQHASSE
jgi:hypothetical protein